MQVVCPSCNSTFNIPDSKIPKKRASAKCKNCGGKIIIDPPSGDMTASAPPAFEETAPPPPPKAPKRTAAPPPSLDSAEALAVKNEYPELVGLERIRLDYGAVFTANKNGGYKNRDNKLKVKVLGAIEEVLPKILKPDETIQRISRGTAYYPAEIFLGNGYFTMLYNHYAIIATDRRLLFLNINSRNNRTTHLFFQADYGNIKKVSSGFLGRGLTLKPQKGKSHTFMGLKGGHGKSLKEFITAKMGMVPVDPALPSSKSVLRKMCPACFTVLEDGLERCSHCGAEFKKRKTAMILSALLPGLGDIYLGHRVLGGMELIGALIVWVIIISLFLDGGLAAWPIALGLLVLVNGFDALLTWHMSGKGYMLHAHSQ